MVGVVGSSPIAPTNFPNLSKVLSSNAMFTLSLHGEESTQALLQSGYSYCLVVRSESQRSALLKNLGDQPGVAIVPHNGGLISNLRVWENIVLPVQYHGIEVAGKLDDNVAQLLLQCGLEDEAAVSDLLLKLPDQLSLYEKRLVGFVRAMLLSPELIIYDSMIEGLSRKELARVVKFDKIFRLYFPFRTSVLVSFEEYKDKDDPRYLVIHL
jgi:predicted ABC-type transport system involved in lysophospholipase L1 biosynthesis ATPase subunit